MRGQAKAQTTALFSLFFVFSLFLLTSCAPSLKTPEPPGGKGPCPATQRSYVIHGKRYYPLASAENFRQKGTASWYGKKFQGRKTANGERYNMYARTAAHKTLPMGTLVRVQNLKNKTQTIVRINDRGPFVKNRIIDLSYTAAKEIGLLRSGTAPVLLTALKNKSSKEEKRKKTRRSTATGKTGERGTTNKYHSASVQTPLYIQVGIFESKNEAKKLARNFAKRGRDVLIQSFPAAGTRFFRVMLLSGTTLNEARKDKRELEENGVSCGPIRSQQQIP